jgi:hypothetical protein
MTARRFLENVAVGARGSSAKVLGAVGRLLPDLMVPIFQRVFADERAMHWIFDYQVALETRHIRMKARIQRQSVLSGLATAGFVSPAAQKRRALRPGDQLNDGSNRHQHDPRSDQQAKTGVVLRFVVGGMPLVQRDRIADSAVSALSR